jgi:hypothetical protein
MYKLWMEFEIIKTQTNMGKECIIVEGFTFRKDSILKCGYISWRCTSNRQTHKVKVRTDLDASKVASGDLTHNHEVNVRMTKRKILIVNVKRKVHEDVSEIPPNVYILKSTKLYTFHPPHWYAFYRPIELWIHPNVNLCNRQHIFQWCWSMTK